MKINYTKVPNTLIRSSKLDVYEKLILITILHFNPSFPSYEKLCELTGVSRGKLWKSLRKLESFNLITRYKKGRSIYYVAHWKSTPGELIDALPVHYVNYTSSPGELETVHEVNSNKTKRIKLSNKTNVLNKTKKKSENLVDKPGLDILRSWRKNRKSNEEKSNE